MPVNGTSPLAPVTGAPSTGSSAALATKAFAADATLAKLAAGAVPPLALGAKGNSVKTVQVALYSLGFIEPRKGLDSEFGAGTKAAVAAFQKSANLAQTGVVDGHTLKALDQAAAKQVATLKAATLPQGSKKDTFRIVADISDPAKTRLYVLGKNDQVAARFLTSPGRAEFPTAGDKFKVRDVLPRKQWNPPNSAWAAKAKPIPPGIDNPMGILKLSLGQYNEYIHGIPAGEEKDLGRAASHGCLRMSGSNVLELGEKYAEAGTEVRINRDRALSAQLEAKYGQAHLQDRPTDAGREYLFGYLSGELGAEQHL